MSRPEGRRRSPKKSTLYPSERDRLLKLCPESENMYQRISLLCRAIALGEYEILDLGEVDWQPPEIQRARDNREDGALGRTLGSRIQRDILFFDLEWDAFSEYLPEDGSRVFRSDGSCPSVSFQDFLRGLASGRFGLAPNEGGRAIQRQRADREECGLCGDPREDAGEYCQSCRTFRHPRAA